MTSHYHDAMFACPIEMGIKAFKRGGGLLNQIINVAKEQSRDLTGKEALDIYNTYAIMPRELAILLASHSLFMDQDDFTKEKMKQTNRTIRCQQCAINEEIR